MSVNWKVAGSLDQLLAQLDELAPERSRVVDGAIGDEDHQNRKSDHNPWLRLAGQHYVTARDFTDDPRGGLDCDALTAALVRGRDQRVKYMIWDSRIMSGGEGRDPWKWRTYRGPNPHASHLHLSVVPDLRSLTRIPWLLPGLTATVGAAVLRRGSRGFEVAELQRVLAAWYPSLRLAVDGIFGPATEAAVRACQQHTPGLAVDGIAGPHTLAALGL